MTILIIGSRPATYSEAVARLGMDYDVVYDVDETPREPAVAPRQVHWLPYLTKPDSVLTLPHLFDYEGILSFVDYGALPAALAASVVSLPGPSVNAVLRTRNKYLMRTTLSQHGFTQPAFGLVGRDEPAPHDFPLMVKPVDGMGSSGVRIVDSPAGLGVIPAGRSMMWESYLDGPQYTVEGVANDGMNQALGVTGKIISGPPHFVVLEHETPAPVDDATRELLTSFAARCLAALEVRQAATHTEIVLHDGAPMIIETHTRPAGDLVPLITRLTTGWDQCELALSQASNRGPSAKPHQTAGMFAKTIHLTPYDSSRESLADPGWLAKYPEVVMFDFSRIYSNRVSYHDSFWGYDPRWGQVVIAGQDRDALRATSTKIRAEARGVRRQ